MKAMHDRDSIALVERQKADMEQINEEMQEANARQEQLNDSTALFYEAYHGTAREVVLQNEHVALTLNTRGGVITTATLKEYKNQKKTEQMTFYTPQDASLNFAFEGKTENVLTKDCVFEPLNVTDSTVTMRLNAANGGYIDFCYRLLADSYMTDLTIQAHGLNGFFSPKVKSMSINWDDRIRQLEKSFSFENRYSALTYKIKDESSDRLSEGKEDEETIEEPVDWIAYKNQFFSAVMIAHQDFTDTRLTSTPEKENSGYLKSYQAQTETFFDPTGKKATQLQFYFGPNKYRLLKATNKLSASNKDLDLEDLVYLGWPLFKYINRFFIIYLFDWLTSWGLPMGIVILLLTLIVKAIVYPATKKSYMSSAKMRVLRPKMEEINKKYPNKEDALQKQQETMALYSKYGVSPMGGCLPMLIQMPIWIALFNFVPNAIELRGQSFLWADDLSAYDDVISWGTHIWGIGDHISIFCLLFTITNILNSWWSMRQQKDQLAASGQAEQMKMMQYMMLIMPIMFFFIFNDYSSGLCYYYFVSGLFSILTMWYLRASTNDEKLLAKLEENYRKNMSNPNRKMSGLAARLEAMQKQLEEQQKMQQQSRK
jgi:YidC/Oxa1 family membrane protein insertase